MPHHSSTPIPLTVSNLVLAANGKTLTGTLGGGTGTGYTIANANGLQPRLPESQGGTYIIPTATPSIVGNQITIQLPTPFTSRDTVQLKIEASNTISDSGGNTIAPTAGINVANNSTVAGNKTLFLSNRDKFNFGGAVRIIGDGISEIEGAFNTEAGGAHSSGYTVEYVINVTSGTVNVDAEAFLASHSGGLLRWQVDGGGQQNRVGNSVGYEFLPLATGLGVGKHIVRHNAPNNFYTRGTRITGGTATIVTVPDAITLFRDNVTDVTLPAHVSQAKRWGTQKGIMGRQNLPHPGFQFNVKVNAQCVDMLAFAQFGFRGLVAVDQPLNTDNYSEVVAQSTLGNVPQSMNLVAGLTPGTHTVEFLDHVGGQFMGIRAYNGSRLSWAADAGSTTITVSDVTNISVGDWLVIDHGTAEEVRCVTSVSGSGPYVLALNSSLSTDTRLLLRCAIRHPAALQHLPTEHFQTLPVVWWLWATRSRTRRQSAPPIRDQLRDFSFMRSAPVMPTWQLKRRIRAGPRRYTGLDDQRSGNRERREHT
jgi:hypothetical protein